MKKLEIYVEDEFLFVLQKFKKHLEKNWIKDNFTEEELTKLLIKFCVANWYNEKIEKKDFKKWVQLNMWY